MLRPLRDRDFRLLWAGMTVSLLGDGVYLVAVAWQAYDVSNSPAALAVTGIAWTLPTVLLLPFGGTLSDRIGRRPLMITADLLRAAAVGVISVLSLSGHLEIWHLVALSAMFGVGEALFGPSFTAIVPEILPRDLLLEANALDQTMRPLAFQFAGPALGGLLVGVWGPGSAFALNAATFLVSAACVALMRVRRVAAREDEPSSMLEDMREGLAYARGQTWLWGDAARVLGCRAGVLGSVGGAGAVRDPQPPGRRRRRVRAGARGGRPGFDRRRRGHGSPGHAAGGGWT